MNPFGFVPLILVFPILGLLTNLVFGRKPDEKWIGIVACGAAALSFGVAMGTLATLLNVPEGGEVELWEWLRIGAFEIPIALKVDALATTMILVVTSVGTLIHIYAVGYMHGDPRFARFFIYLNLFLFAMLVLVLAGNYLLLFVGWELVGLCSYLLIGFWFEDLKNADAARKAFIVNRVGDFAFILGALLIFVTFGSLRYDEVFPKAEEVFRTGAPVITAITLLLFVGATGKSAQIPLFVWLPDAMAGPTPVSALIHAATMVTAGVYMIARSEALYNLAPLTQSVVAWIGAVTALFAALIAIAQWDMKKVMAYSTISQLGYMIAAVGLGGYVAGIFHLITHAFFKALLFLSAGSVMHGCGNEGDMRNLGGLRRAMPTTFKVFVVGGLGLAGVPIFAGFWSKDEIITEAFENNAGVFVLLLAAAGITAFYVFRQLYLVFGGEQRSHAYHSHENPRVMTWPLLALAALVAVGGLVNAPPFNLLTRFLGGEEVPFEFGIAGASVGLAALGWLAAWSLYGRRPLRAGQADPLQRILGPAYTLVERKFLVDELYGVLFVRPFQWLSRVAAFIVDERFLHDFVHNTILIGGYNRWSRLLAGPLDRSFIDRGIERAAALSRDLGSRLREMQSGYVRRYVLWFALGAVAVMGYFLVQALR
ncbi:MAG TPA: NADH-quinone oxidoreductase subunit L [Anaerolineae bacterium]|nr:NADH-quinone oxidoreductase subunit L [Anaerolineae bacterium]